MVYEIESCTLVERETAVEFATLSVHEIGPWLQRTLGEVAAYLERKGAGPVGMPFARYHRVAGDRFEVEAGFAATTPIAGEGEVEPSDLPGGPAAVAVHVGSYGAIAHAYQAIEDWVHTHGVELVGDPWEVYFSDPDGDDDPSTWRTEIVQPYKARRVAESQSAG